MKSLTRNVSPRWHGNVAYTKEPVVVMCCNPFCLGEPWCSEWGCCTMEPAKKKARTEAATNWFFVPVSSPRMQKIFKGYIPKNTEKATSWALHVFTEWWSQRNKSSKEKCPETLLERPSTDSLNYRLSQFVIQCRCEDGKPYPPSTIFNILAGLYRYSRGCVRSPQGYPNFMNRKDPNFRDLTGAIQVQYRELREEGIGAIVKHATVISSALWDSKVIGDDSPLALQRVVFYYVGKTFCLRGGDEQCNLKPSQFMRSSAPDCYTYIEMAQRTDPE